MPVDENQQTELRLPGLNRPPEGRTAMPLWVWMLVGMGFGVATGVMLSETAGYVEPDNAETIAEWLSLPGHIFLKVLNLAVAPLMVSSLILAVRAQGDLKTLRDLGLRIMPYFIVTTSVAVALGIVVGLWVDPGQLLSPQLQSVPNVQLLGNDLLMSPQGIPERIIALVPENPVEDASNANLLRIMVFAILAGTALAAIPSTRSLPLYDLVDSIQVVTMRVVSWAMRMAPVAAFGLLVQTTMKVGLQTLVGMSAYLLTVLFCLVVMLFIQLLIVRLMGFSVPDFLMRIREVQTLAFTTASSSASLPVSIKVADDMGLPSRVSRFVLPVATMVNMDGTAVYQSVSVMFLAQAYGIDLNVSQLVLVATTVVGTSVVTPGLPGSGMTVMVALLISLGIPDEGIAIILAVERLLDMCRTVVNVTGDLTACVVADRWTSASENADPHP